MATAQVASRWNELQQHEPQRFFRPALAGIQTLFLLRITLGRMGYRKPKPPRLSIRGWATLDIYLSAKAAIGSGPWRILAAQLVEVEGVKACAFSVGRQMPGGLFLWW